MRKIDEVEIEVLVSFRFYYIYALLLTNNGTCFSFFSFLQISSYQVEGVEVVLVSFRFYFSTTWLILLHA
ncbi:hypothetical protein YN1HA_18820 [Sulfurisphaera ohwakuensis]